MPESTEMRTKEVVSTSPLAPALEERNYHHNTENFCIVFCSKTISVVVAPVAPLSPALQRAGCARRGSDPGPALSDVTATSLNFPLGK